jgi:hypothetical protein
MEVDMPMSVEEFLEVEEWMVKLRAELTGLAPTTRARRVPAGAATGSASNSPSTRPTCADSGRTSLRDDAALVGQPTRPDERGLRCPDRRPG